MKKTSSLLVVLAVVCYLLATCSCSDSPTVQCHYSIVAHWTIKPSSPFQFNVFFYCPQNQEAKVKASIIYWPGQKVNQTRVLVSKNVAVKSGEQKLSYLYVPSSSVTRNSKYNFNFTTLVEYGENSFNHTKSVNVNPKVISIFIQTDKKLYKPGQKIRYRALVLTNKLKPYANPINLTIEDDNDNLIVQKVNANLTSGVYTGELQLSKVTPLGFWKINVVTKEEKQSQTFEVAEYVLPKYEVNVELPKHYFISDGDESNDYDDDVDVSDDSKTTAPKKQDLNLAVTAKYTYGEPVKGVALVIFKLRESWYRKKEASPTINKIVQLTDGKADLSISYKDLLSLIPCSSSSGSLRYQSIEVSATVTEQATGKLLKASGSVDCITHRYNFKFVRSSSVYKPGFTYKAYLKLSHADLPVPLISDIKHADGTFKTIPVEVTFHVRNYSSSLETVHFATFNELGEAVLSLDIEKNIRSVSFNARYKDEVLNKTLYASHYATEFTTRDKKFIQISTKVLDDVLKPEKVTTFVVQTTEPISTFCYQILSKGAINQAKVFKYNRELTSHEFNLTLTKEQALDLAPRAKILVYYVNRGDEIVADVLTINVLDYFVNKLSISFDKNATNPSKPITLNVEAEANSFVGLLAVDKSVLLLRSAPKLSTEVAQELNKFGPSSSYWHDSREDFLVIPPSYSSDTEELIKSASLVMFSGSHIHNYRYVPVEEVYDDDESDSYADSVGETYAGQAGPVGASTSTMKSINSDRNNNNNNNLDNNTPRTEFPETWIWSDVTVDKTGKHKLELKVPDTITSWSASAFATHDTFGLGVVDGPVEVKVTKPLFVSLNLPYSVTRGEEFALQATVFNYLDEDVEVRVKLAKSDYFKTRSCDAALNKLESLHVLKTIKISKNNVGSVYFWVVPTSLGQVAFEVSAQTAVAGDVVKELVLVKPEGVSKNYDTTSFLKATTATTQTTSTTINLPADYVEGSAVIQVSAIGDILAPTLKNLGNLVRIPSGCGEQNIINFAPNVLILDYLKATGQLDEERENGIKAGLLSGYQKQLTYKRSDGSFSAFGNDDLAGSVWLSAFVLKSFHQARPYIPITNDSLVGTIRWILKHQNEDGSFSELPFGRVIHSKMQGGVNSRFSITAYVLIALNVNKDLHTNKVNIKASIRKATQYLERELSNNTNDPYILGIVAYAFYSVGSNKFDRVVNKLYSVATTENDKVFWKQPDLDEEEKDAWSLKEFASTYDIELTSYVLLLRASQKNLNLSLPIARWLIDQMSGIGGFSSTQDTVLALEALAKFAPLVAYKEGSEGLKVKVQGDLEEHDLSAIKKDNSLVLQTVQLSDKTRSIKVSANGDGFVLLQTSVQYNRINVTSSKLLNLNLKVDSHEKVLNLTLSTSWSGSEVSGMVLVEVNVPTGFVLKDQSVYKSKLVPLIAKRVEITPTKIVVYLNGLQSTGVEFTTTFEESLPVHDVKPALVEVYRYYQPSVRASGFYSPLGKRSWVSSCPQCCD